MWGLFTKNNISKNSYVIDYCGEIITNREANSRGKIYDSESLSYLFDISESVDEKYMKIYNKFCKKHRIDTHLKYVKLDEDDFPLV
jgi:SET domain-containing protein